MQTDSSAPPQSAAYFSVISDASICALGSQADDLLLEPAWQGAHSVRACTQFSAACVLETVFHCCALHPVKRVGNARGRATMHL